MKADSSSALQNLKHWIHLHNEFMSQQQAWGAHPGDIQHGFSHSSN